MKYNKIVKSVSHVLNCTEGFFFSNCDSFRIIQRYALKICVINHNQQLFEDVFTTKALYFEKVVDF